VLDGPAVPVLAAYTELDERYEHAVIVAALKNARRQAPLPCAIPQTITRVLPGALTRGAALIADSADGRHSRHRAECDHGGGSGQ
jgi:hypothetical protein